MKVLFVCLGNICRSPMAETIFRDRVEKAGLTHFEIDSAGTGNWHVGELADPRMRKHAGLRGYTITSIARAVADSDFSEFDKIIAMDDDNVKNLKRRCPDEYLHKISKMTDYARNCQYSEVPDPYYGGEKGFETVIDLLENATEGLLEHLNF